jgi:hypothetical protein
MPVLHAWVGLYANSSPAKSDLGHLEEILRGGRGVNRVIDSSDMKSVMAEKKGKNVEYTM